MDPVIVTVFTVAQWGALHRRAPEAGALPDALAIRSMQTDDDRCDGPYRQRSTTRRNGPTLRHPRRAVDLSEGQGQTIVTVIEAPVGRRVAAQRDLPDGVYAPNGAAP